MKKVLIFIALFLIGGIKLSAFTVDSDSLGLPGDNLDLSGVLDLFKTSSNLEDFEKKLNDPTNEVNNLDLNDDQNVDYIRVLDQIDGDAHAIVLQVPISATESQDVAVIALEKNGTESADLQIVGDEELYGKNYVVEAKSDENSSATDGKWQGFRPVTVFVNVWMWPCVRFVYAPAYVVWVSPWRYMYYPPYWKPWHPVMWRVHHERVVHYHMHYCCVHECRMHRACAYYDGHRVASPDVHRRNAVAHERHDANNSHRNANGAEHKTNPNAPRNQNQQHRKPNGKTAAPRNGANGGAQNRAGANGGGQKKGGGGNKGGGQNKGGKHR